jgi:hypothetical protein
MGDPRFVLAESASLACGLSVEQMAFLLWAFVSMGTPLLIRISRH